MDWAKDNWFKVAVVILILLAALSVFYYYVIFLPSEKRAEREIEETKIAAENARVEAEKLAEEEKALNLSTCLEESEYQRNTAHLATCGDPNVGKASESCHDVFGGVKNESEAFDRYESEFPGDLPEAPEDFDIEVLTEYLNDRIDILNNFWDQCNCGLEKFRRDELDAQKEARDEICFNLYQ